MCRSGSADGNLTSGEDGRRKCFGNTKVRIMNKNTLPGGAEAVIAGLSQVRQLGGNPRPKPLSYRQTLMEVVRWDRWEIS